MSPLPVGTGAGFVVWWVGADSAELFISIEVVNVKDVSASFTGVLFAFFLLPDPEVWCVLKKVLSDVGLSGFVLVMTITSGFEMTHMDCPSDVVWAEHPWICRPWKKRTCTQSTCTSPLGRIGISNYPLRGPVHGQDGQGLESTMRHGGWCKAPRTNIQQSHWLGVGVLGTSFDGKREDKKSQQKLVEKTNNNVKASEESSWLDTRWVHSHCCGG